MVSGIPRETQPNINFFVLPRAKSRAKSLIAQKALLEKGMFGSVSHGSEHNSTMDSTFHHFNIKIMCGCVPTGTVVAIRYSLSDIYILSG